LPRSSRLRLYRPCQPPTVSPLGWLELMVASKYRIGGAYAKYSSRTASTCSFAAFQLQHRSRTARQCWKS
jgi:hypothetical protein